MLPWKTAVIETARFGGYAMNVLAARRAEARALWELVPLELVLSAFAIILAGALKYADVMP
ncbi:hypothetical protein ASF41_11245 [Methylobacterium sp. Leaf111]|nr:hypothetical protein ASF41_11245 [Methylobacterium sp. Leaf111]